ncbi:hypothetical protein OIO90_001871 [Microbotryomycetes sp. JL221]|nr:hypothetical protein OIO90_001871 [Microbotryomycetes sp. JL221]
MDTFAHPPGLQSVVYRALLVALFAFSVVGLGLGATLCSTVGPMPWPAFALDSVTIQATFALTWTTLFTGLFLMSALFCHWTNSLLLHFVTLFLAFLQLIVAAGSMVTQLDDVACSNSACQLNSQNCLQEYCATFWVLNAMLLLSICCLLYHGWLNFYEPHEGAAIKWTEKDTIEVRVADGDVSESDDSHHRNGLV